MSNDQSRWTSESLKNTVQAVGIILASAWGIYTFVYQTWIAPGRIPPYVVATLQLEPSGVHESAACLTARVRLKNAGRIRAYTLASALTITGFRVQSVVDTLIEANAVQALQQGSRVYRHFEPSKEKVLAVSSIVPPGWTFEEGEEFEKDLLVCAPPRAYDAAKLTVLVKLATHYSPLVLEKWTQLPNGDYWPNTFIIQGRDTMELDLRNPGLRTMQEHLHLDYLETSVETIW